MKDKKSFLFYTDWIDTFESIPDDKAGQLIKHICRYVNDQNPQSDDVLINAVFANIKNQLKRDLDSYLSIVARNKENGKKGGRPKKNPENPVGYSGNPEKPKKADTDTDTDTDKGKVIDINTFIAYAKEKKPNVNEEAVRLKYDSWVANGWKDGNDKPIKNWKSKLLNTLPHIKEDQKQKKNNAHLFMS